MNYESAPTQPGIKNDHVRLPTQHGLMVAWGQFAQDTGLIEGFMHVPVAVVTSACSDIPASYCGTYDSFRPGNHSLGDETVLDIQTI